MKKKQNYLNTIYKKYCKKFEEEFDKPLLEFWDNEQGFNTDEFSKFIKGDSKELVLNVVKSKFGEKARSLLMDIVDDEYFMGKKKELIKNDDVE